MMGMEVWTSSELDVGADSEPLCHCEPQHQTKRGILFLGEGGGAVHGLINKEEATPVRKKSCQPSEEARPC